MKDLKLPEHLREKLKKPFGNLIREWDKSNLKSSGLIICVGDKTSEKVLGSGVIPKICIYDGKIMRREIKIPEMIDNFNAEKIHAKNPAGYLTRDLFDSVRRALNSGGNFKIFVDGEEDLATLAAIYLAPISSLVLYGQPKEGIVMVNVNKKSKEFVNGILDEMIKSGNRNFE